MSAKNSCKTAAVMGSLSKGTTAERDVQLLADKHRDIEAITAEILEAKRVGGEAILVIGKGLIEAKAMLPHGKWLLWLEERVEFSEKAAQRFMRLAREYSNPTALGGEIPVPQEDGTVKMVDPKEELRRSWERVHRGAGNAMRLAVLDLGLKYQPISMNNTDAQFVESNEVRVADVCRFFGVPLHLAYAGRQSYESNEQNGIEYVNYTLLGYETQWSQEDSYKLLLPGERERGLRIKRELKVFLRGDTAAQAAFYTSLRNVGGLNANEIRALEDMGAIPGGDSYYASWNYGPLDQWARLSVLRALGKTGAVPPMEGGDKDG